MALLRAIEMDKKRLGILERLAKTGSVPDTDGGALEELRYWALIDGDHETYHISERGWGFLLGLKAIPSALVYSIPKKRVTRFLCDRMVTAQDIIPGFSIVQRRR